MYNFFCKNLVSGCIYLFIRTHERHENELMERVRNLPEKYYMYIFSR